MMTKVPQGKKVAKSDKIEMIVCDIGYKMADGVRVTRVREKK